MAIIPRRKTVTAVVGGVRVGSDAPVVVQSMTNTDTADIPATVQQCAAWPAPGLNWSVSPSTMKKPPPPFPHCRRTRQTGYPRAHHRRLPLQRTCPAHQVSRVRRDLAKYRINPGNASIGRTGDSNFRTVIEVAVKYQKPVRIGVNWGSLDQVLLTRMMDENSAWPSRSTPAPSHGSDGGKRAELRRPGAEIRPPPGSNYSERQS